MAHSVTIRYGALHQSLEWPEGKIDVASLSKPEKKKVIDTLVASYCAANGIELKKPRRRKRRRR